MAKRFHGQRALLLARPTRMKGTAMLKTSAERVQAAKDGLLRLAEHEMPWEGDKENASSSFTRFPPIDTLLADLDHVSDQWPPAL